MTDDERRTIDGVTTGESDGVERIGGGAIGHVRAGRVGSGNHGRLPRGSTTTATQALG